MINYSGLRFNFILLFIFLSLILFCSFVSAGTLQVTEEHPFLINGSWVSASDLVVGDFLQTLNGKSVRITGIKDVSTSKPFFVYNLEAGLFHDFIVNGGDGLGVVVHNSDANEIQFLKDSSEEVYHMTTTEAGASILQTDFFFDLSRYTVTQFKPVIPKSSFPADNTIVFKLRVPKESLVKPIAGGGSLSGTVQVPSWSVKGLKINSMFQVPARLHAPYNRGFLTRVPKESIDWVGTVRETFDSHVTNWGGDKSWLTSEDFKIFQNMVLQSKDAKAMSLLNQLLHN
jgi:hypothetical protein